MTKIIRLLIIMLSVLVGGANNYELEQNGQSKLNANYSGTQEVNSSSAHILSISYEYGSLEEGYLNFSLLRDNGQVLFNAQGSNGIFLEINSQPVSDNVLVELQKIITDNDIILWNGFSKRDEDIPHGYSFILNIVYENGSKLTASGYMMEPDNYEQGHAALSEYLLALADTYKKYRLLDYKRMADEKYDLPIGVEVSVNNTPNGGVFSVAFFTDSNGVLVPKDEAMYMEIHECDENGNSIYRTYLKRE